MSVLALRRSVFLFLAPLALVAATLMPATATAAPGDAELHGLVGDRNGNLLDDVVVEAFDVQDPDGPPVASSLTYASSAPDGPQHGYYSLFVPAGTYVLRYSSLPDRDLQIEPIFWGEQGGGEAIEVTVDTGGEVGFSQMTVSEEGDADLVSVTGHVVDPEGTALDGVHVVPYAFDQADGVFRRIQPHEPVFFTQDGGNFSGLLSDESVVTLQFLRSGFQPMFLGGGHTLPTAPTAENSRTLAGNTAIGDVVLLPRVSALGNVAGQNLSYCRDNTLPANDDGFSDAVSIPFPLTYFGEPYTQLFVNNNGNVTFNDGRSEYTPESLTGDTGVPIIAPFFADVDTLGIDSSEVTWGASPDGNSLCVNWADVGYFNGNSDKLDTFQLILTRNDESEGRVLGDFDITFNYDSIQWETGDASDGSGGFGGTSAAVGFSAGTGDPGTFVQMAGSFDNGALLDGGPNALVSGFQGTTQPGRYIFQVRNSGVAAALGNLDGQVRDEDGGGIDGALVQVCRSGGSSCSSLTPTNSEGNYSFTGLRVGTYSINVNPPEGVDLFPANGSGNVSEGTTTADPITLTAPRGAPEGVGLSNGSGSDPFVGQPYFPEDGPPIVHYRANLNFSVTGCPGVTDPTYTQVVEGVVLQDHQPLSEVSPGHYSAVIPMAYPAHGDASLTTNVPLTCDAGAAVVGFDLYIDPSGVVTDQFGRPMAGVQVTLLRADSGAEPFSPVPNGSAVMSPSNRTNPDVTDAVGYFQWDVLTGWYQVGATAAGCVDATTDALEVPPARLDLLIKMTCEDVADPAPTTAPELSGTPQVGQTLTATNGVWSNGIVHTKTEWLRDSNVIATGSSYVLQSADQGEVITARVTGQRPNYTQESGAGGVVSFAETHVDLASAQVTAAPGGGGGGGGTPSAPVNTTAPSVTGVAKVGQTLVANPGSWDQGGLTFSYQWLRAGSPVAGATGHEYAATLADLGQQVVVRVTAAKSGLPDGSASSAPVAIGLGDAPTALAPPVITGDALRGSLLRVSSGSWDIGDLGFTYQWLRDGVAIAGATASEHTVTAADEGSALTAVVTATREGFADGQATSGAVSVPAPPPPTQATSTTTARLVDDTITRLRNGIVKARVVRSDGKPIVGTVQVSVDGKAKGHQELVRRDQGRARMVLPALQVGVHHVVVRYLGTDDVRGSRAGRMTLTVGQVHSGRAMPIRLTW